MQPKKYPDAQIYDESEGTSDDGQAAYGNREASYDSTAATYSDREATYDNEATYDDTAATYSNSEDTFEENNKPDGEHHIVSKACMKIDQVKYKCGEDDAAVHYKQAEHVGDKRCKKQNNELSSECLVWATDAYFGYIVPESC